MSFGPCLNRQVLWLYMWFRIKKDVETYGQDGSPFPHFFGAGCCCHITAPALCPKKVASEEPWRADSSFSMGPSCYAYLGLPTGFPIEAQLASDFCFASGCLCLSSAKVRAFVSHCHMDLPPPSGPHPSHPWCIWPQYHGCLVNWANNQASVRVAKALAIFTWKATTCITIQCNPASGPDSPSLWSKSIPSHHPQHLWEWGQMSICIWGEIV